MFRLVFLAFHGERRIAAEHAGNHHESAHAGARHHGHAPHDAPPSMAIPLIVLAIGSILAGYVGVPHALGGSNRIERFLEPSFEVEIGRRAETAATQPAGAGETVRTVAIQDPEPSH